MVMGDFASQPEETHASAARSFRPTFASIFPCPEERFQSARSCSKSFGGGNMYSTVVKTFFGEIHCFNIYDYGYVQNDNRFKTSGKLQNIRL